MYTYTDILIAILHTHRPSIYVCIYNYEYADR